jgi:peptidyl-prolyl cis-trans isomerase D
MLRQRSLAVAALAATAALAACDSLKGAIGNHVDTVAKAGSQELTVGRLAQLLGQSQVPIAGPQGREVARTLAGLWVDYQLLGASAARGDSLSDTKTVDDAMWAVVAQQRIAKYGQQVLARQNFDADTGNAAQRYANGEMLSARHILVGFSKQPPQPGQPVPPAVRDSALRRVQALQKQVTPANFADLARTNSSDTQSAQQGGSLGVFPPGVMVPTFEKALAGLKPGQISEVVETPYGCHLIYRPQFAEIANQITPQVYQGLAQRKRQAAESTYLAKLETDGKIDVKGDAPLWTKSIAQNVEEHYKDNKVLATSTAGDLTASRVARWISALPQNREVRSQIQNAPDSLVKLFVKQMARQELLLKQADSAKIQLDTGDVSNMRRAFIGAVTNLWQGLNVAPAQLADSAKAEADRQRLAAARIENYLDRLVQQRAQFLDVPAPITVALRTKYEHKMNDAGLDRALEQAAQVRATRDSAKAAGQPPTAVPLPGEAPVPGAPAAPGAPPADQPGAPGVIPPPTGPGGNRP